MEQKRNWRPSTSNLQSLGSAWNPEALNVQEAWRAPFGLIQAQISSKRQPLPYLRGRQIPDRLPSMVLTSLQYIQPPPMGFMHGVRIPRRPLHAWLKGQNLAQRQPLSCLHDFQTSRRAPSGGLRSVHESQRKPFGKF